MRIILRALLAISLVAGASCRKTRKSAGRARCDVPTVAITTPYPGAGVEIVEQAVLIPLEEAIRGIAGIKRIRSVAAEGHGTIYAEIDGRSSDSTLAEVREEVDRVSALPADAEHPQTYLVDRPAETAMLVVEGDHGLRALEDTANALRDEVLQDPSVRRAWFVGMPEREIEVQVDPGRLAAFGLTAEEVASALRMDSVHLPSGAATGLQGQVVLRPAAGAARAEELGNVVVHRSSAGAVVFLRDIATIRDGYAASGTRARFGDAPAIAIAVSPRDDHREQFVPSLRTAVAALGATAPDGVRGRFLGTIVHCTPKGKRGPNEGVIRAELRLPSGHSREQSLQLHERAMAAIGDSKSGVLAILDSPEHAAEASLELLAFRKDTGAATEEARRWQGRFAEIPGVSGLVESAGHGQLTIQLAHVERETLQNASSELRTTLSGLEGILSVGGASARGELQFSVNERGRRLGIRQQDVARVVRDAVFGIEVSRFQRGRQEVRVMLRVGGAGSSATDLEQVENLGIGNLGDQVSLRDVATISYGLAPNRIERIDGRRITSVRVSVDSNRMAIGELSKLLRDQVLSALEQKHPGLTIEIAASEGVGANTGL